MADAVNTIIDAVKEMVQDVGEKVGAAVKDALHVPDNFAPMVQTLKELVTSGQKFASGEGSTEELNGLSTKLSSFSAMVDTLEDGPLKKMVLTLRDQAVSQLKDVKGSEKVGDSPSDPPAGCSYVFLLLDFLSSTEDSWRIPIISGLSFTLLSKLEVLLVCAEIHAASAPSGQAFENIFALSFISF
ncbi:hypothetical protein Naga_100058g26 [Nannochloropsis gaditana]|uniref:Uncharacterized protein n=1 Tax=Nannochloropsis gaditana TaxID=72520 RepID=W7TQW7_9STRA|nr:hypothetical protein Naga_100058g26 [Nannochloropsis gaditana]